MSDEQLYHCARCGKDQPLSDFGGDPVDCIDCQRRMALIDAAVVQLYRERQQQRKPPTA